MKSEKKRRVVGGEEGAVQAPHLPFPQGAASGVRAQNRHPRMTMRTDPSLSGERSVVANVDADVGVPAPVSEEACVPETPVSS